MPSFNDIPPAIIVEFTNPHKRFLEATGIASNSQYHHEIVRQFFDSPSFNFINFTNFIQTMPRGDLRRLSVPGTNESFVSPVLHAAIMEYGVAIYMELVQKRLIIGDVFPAVIETIYHDAITFILDREWIVKHVQ